MQVAYISCVRKDYFKTMSRAGEKCLAVAFCSSMFSACRPSCAT